MINKTLYIIIFCAVLGFMSVIALALTPAEAASIIERERKMGLYLSDPVTGEEISSASVLGFRDQKIEIDCAIQYEMEKPEQLGLALGQIFSIRKLNVTTSSFDGRVPRLLSTFPPDPNISTLFVFTNVSEDVAILMLEKCPNVGVCAIIGSPFTGEKLPLLDKMTDWDLSYSAITDKGLEKIGKLPNLKVLHLKDCAITAEGIRALISSQTKIEKLRIREISISEQVARSLEVQFKNAVPSAEIVIVPSSNESTIE